MRKPEQNLIETQQAKLAMIEEINARNVSGWLDPVSDEEQAILEYFSPEEQKALWIMTEEEHIKFSKLLRREGEVQIALSKLIAIAAERAPR
jgi:hypothetical protein